jgi:type IV pilus assembly protein PilE
MKSNRIHAAFARANRGMSLSELLVVLAIVSILGAIGYPSYTGYVTRANRSAAKSLLLQIADRQEQYFADNKRYANDMTQLGFATNGFAIDNQGAPVSTSSYDRLYAISLSNTSATTFTVNAAPLLGQSSRDTDCGTLTLTHAGQKGQSGAGNSCW